MEGSEIAKRDHQRNKSEIVKLVKEMFSQDKWGNEEYKKKLQSSKHGMSPNAKRTWNKKKLSENPDKIIKRLDKKFTNYEKKLKKLGKKLEEYTPLKKYPLLQVACE